MPRVRNKKNWRSHLKPWKPEKRVKQPPSSQRFPKRGDVLRDRSGRERLVHSAKSGQVVYGDLKAGSLHSISLSDWMRWVSRSEAEVVSRGYPVPETPTANPFAELSAVLRGILEREEMKEKGWMP